MGRILLLASLSVIGLLGRRTFSGGRDVRRQCLHDLPACEGGRGRERETATPKGLVSPNSPLDDRSALSDAGEHASRLAARRDGTGSCRLRRRGRIEAVAPGDLPPIRRDYRDLIVRWADGFYAPPRDVRRAGISDPTLVRDATGRLAGLSASRLTSALRDGRSDRQVVAFGFTPGRPVGAAPAGPLRHHQRLLRRASDRVPALPGALAPVMIRAKKAQRVSKKATAPNR
jgi:hypothetical protein